MIAPEVMRNEMVETNGSATSLAPKVTRTNGSAA